ncbi:MAG: hypothetical protein EB078_05680 [Proteobacteria bacterium]|nr:hypothetical protein [Pseudomonadota bacterium]NDC24500.1 hypothetical protein [Pseudomonadota bacterium]NDD04375.1 hypothetical protein [Pseudomonadota bacterium]NDG27642.1 hypothetical protein [Pseudomonadota bacterium]
MKRFVALVMALSLTVGCGKTPSGGGGTPNANQLAAILSIVAVTYPLLVNQSQGVDPTQIANTFMALAASGALGPEAQAILSDPKNQQLIATLMVALQGGPQAQAALSQFISFGTPAETAQSLSNILAVLQVAAPAMGVSMDPATQAQINLMVAMLPVVISLVNSAQPAPKRA